MTAPAQPPLGAFAQPGRWGRAAKRAHQVAQLEPAVRAEVERLARALCRRLKILATCGDALLVVRKSG